MRFEVVLLAALIGGTLSRYVPGESEVDKAFYDIIKTKFPEQVAALRLEGLEVPDIEFSVAASSEVFPERKVTLRQGKVEGLSTVVRPRGLCWDDLNKDIICHVTFDGLRITYEATATNPDKTFPVEVYAAHSLVDMNIGKKAGHYELKDMKLRSLFLWDRLPVEFTGDANQNVVFQNELRLKLYELLKKETLTDAVKEAFAIAVASKNC